MTSRPQNTTLVRGVPVTRDANAHYVGRVLAIETKAGGTRIRISPDDVVRLDRLDKRGGGLGNWWASDDDREGQRIRSGMLTTYIIADEWRDVLLNGEARSWVPGDYLWAERVR